MMVAVAMPVVIVPMVIVLVTVIMVVRGTVRLMSMVMTVIVAMLMTRRCDTHDLSGIA